MDFQELSEMLMTFDFGQKAAGVKVRVLTRNSPCTIPQQVVDEISDVSNHFILVCEKLSEDQPDHYDFPKI